MNRGRNARTLRIIAGTWRGRRFRFPDVAQIRPTPDRVRETLFNWLQYEIAGADCLDLFAGSGALGLESLSRGAKWVSFVDRDMRVAAHLQYQIDQLKIAHAEIICATAQSFLQQTKRRFDIVFVDPPFSSNAELPALLHTLAASHCAIKDGGWVYLETPARAPLPDLPASWRVHRDARAGQVRSVLLRCPSDQISVTNPNQSDPPP